MINFRDLQIIVQRKIIHNTTERNARTQSVPNIAPAVKQDPVNIISAKPKLLAAHVENRGTQSLG